MITIFRDSIEPRVEDITDVINRNYHLTTRKSLKELAILSELEIALSKDYDSEMKATELEAVRQHPSSRLGR